MKAEQKTRNYTLDLLRVIAGLLMASFHWIWNAVNVYGEDVREVINGYWGAYTYPEGLNGWSWFKGTYTMGFFVFVTGYFMVAHFKGQQRKGVLGQGHDMEHVYRYTAKTYVGYAPLMLFATTFGWILANGKAGAAIMDWINTLVWNIWQFVGLSGFGMHQRLTETGSFINIYAPQCWYIAAFMVFCCVWYCVFIMSEKAAIFILCPVMLAMSNAWLDSSSWWSALDANGIAALLPCDVVRLWGPLTWGIWGWYLVDAVKRSSLTQKGRNILGAAFVVVVAYALITSWTGYLGGMLNQDFVWMAVAAIILIERDPVTLGVNKALNKFPLAKYMADFSAGLYLTHEQLLLNFGKDWIDTLGNKTVAGILYMGVTCLCAAGFVVLMRLVLKPLYGRLGKALKLNTPVGKAFEEQVPAAR